MGFSITSNNLILEHFQSKQNHLFFKKSIILTLLVFVVTITTSEAQTTWLGTTSTDWFDATNWSDGVPDVNDNVTIDTGANNPTISTTGALANSVRINDETTLFIGAAGQLDIDLVDNAEVQDGLLVLGTLDNSGTLTIGATTSGGDYGIYLGIVEGSDDPGTIQNRAGAVLQVDNCITFGIYFSTAVGSVFNNFGTINIGSVGNIGNSGLFVSANSFTNFATGILNINSVSTAGIWINTGGTFGAVNNSGVININDSIANLNYGIRVTDGTFTNTTTGEINIDNVEINSIVIEAGQSMVNNNILNIGQIANGGVHGVFIEGTFQNSTGGGTITIDNTSEIAILLSSTGNFDNFVPSIINLGSDASIGDTGIYNSGDFNNDSQITINRYTAGGIVNIDATFSSEGTIVIGNIDAGSIGIQNFGASASFTNFISTTTGSIEINNVNTGFVCPSGLFENRSQITVGNMTSVPALLAGAGTDTFRNQIDGSGVITANGEISASAFTNNGGLLDPSSLGFGVAGFGVLSFDGDEDFNQSIINIDISDDAGVGIVSDLIEVQGIATLLGGTLNIAINFPTTPTDGQVVTFFRSDALTNEFTLATALPTNWTIVYDFPSVGEISIEFGEINSTQSGAFSDPNTWASGVVPGADTPVIVNNGHTVTLDVPTIEVGRLEVSETATVIVPIGTEVIISGSQGPAVINEGTIEMDGVLSIDGSQSSGINNNGTINLSGQISITNTINEAINNSGVYVINDNASTIIDIAPIGIVNGNDFTINQNGNLNIDFTTNTAILTQTGSTLTNNGITLIGGDLNPTNSVGLYGIDHTGYIINSASGIMEISNATDTLLLFNDPPAGTGGRNINDGIVLNNGQMTLFSAQLNAVEQSDNATQIKGKYKHVLKKRPTPNPGRDINSIASFLNEALALLRGSGIIETQLSFLNGGVIAPGLLAGDVGVLIFDGPSEDLQNVTLEIDINGKTLKGTDYDLIASTGEIILGGDVAVNFGYTPVEGDVIPFIEATSVVGSFSNITLPTDWSIRYNYPNTGNVSFQFGDILNIEDNNLEDLKIYNAYDTKDVVVLGLLNSETTFELYDIMGRFILSKDLDKTTTVNRIDVSNLSIGSYIVKLKTDLNGSKTQKLIIK
ncbi:T9SS type A sorting domain-containing protein [Winogradskyella sp. UBA3174]|uniref:T9SS type A sorting domain-containing protein n=1 Tax=Winogradskyella sp. UBA3174 TaxID=1947785 RepID=UPI0025EDCE43|nr:T9SS type A sorting domain-containing protein [Winogradskyella sp. UBA3174]|tara:strand:+ start:4454 stop:7855 length:3402 start_codon:yes stop_codon:yes gene_type:complete